MTAAAERLAAFGVVNGLVRDLDHAQIAGDLPKALSPRFEAPRYRARLERRFVRRTALLDALDAELPEPGLRVAALGIEGLRTVIVDTGVMCQYAALRRIVDQSVLADLSDQIGFDLAAHDARRATDGAAIDLARSIAAPDPDPMNDPEAIIHAILRDGLQCWTCWIHARPPALERFFNALMPDLPESGTEVASTSCKPHECRRRADLLDMRLDEALPERGESI